MVLTLHPLALPSLPFPQPSLQTQQQQEALLHPAPWAYTAFLFCIKELACSWNGLRPGGFSKDNGFPFHRDASPAQAASL